MKGAGAAPEDARHLIFRVSGHPHAIRLLEIREIIECEGLETVPGAPAGLQGVADLRGTAVPVVDLAALLGLPAAVPSREACVLILDATVDGGAGVLGFLATSVSHVVEVPGEMIQPLARPGATGSEGFLKGVARIEGQFVPVLDPSTLVAAAAANADSPAPAGGDGATARGSTEPA